jgi:hypothetical protein
MVRPNLDLCCFNHPFDDQSQTKIHLETEAKLALQEHVRSGRIEIIWSYILDIENHQTPFLERAESIGAWHAMTADRVSGSGAVLTSARQPSALGVKAYDALHMGCTLSVGAATFVSTDGAQLRHLRGVPGLRSALVFP